MTTTFSNVEVVKNDLFFLVYKALTKNAFYASIIQSVIEYEIVSCLMVNSSTLVMGGRSGALQILEID
jgi:hypothetical protein